MVTLKLPKVQVSAILRERLLANGQDPEAFAEYFAEWKTEGPQAEYTDYYFGKDGRYAYPQRNRQAILRHVHMPPERDPDEIVKWTAAWERGGRKTSDTSLIYAEDSTHGYLLLYLAREPQGHELSQMKTDVSRALMNDLADAAEAFIHDGSIII